MNGDITRTYTVVGSKETLLMLERLLSWLHWNGRWGHSGKVAMPFDGDGNNEFTVNEAVADRHKDYIRDMDSGKDVEVVYAD